MRLAELKADLAAIDKWEEQEAIRVARRVAELYEECPDCSTGLRVKQVRAAAWRTAAAASGGIPMERGSS